MNIDIMKIEVIRKYLGKDYTVGDLYIDGKWFCNTIEDVVRPLPETCPYTVNNSPCRCKGKIQGKTAIPAGTYKVIVSYSSRFDRFLPAILNVPHFIGIRIHNGVNQNNSSGCIIVGINSIKGQVTNSTYYMNKLTNLLKESKDNIITIINQ